MAAFVTVHVRLYRKAVYRKLTIRVLPLPPQNEIQLLSRFFCYFEAGSCLRKTSPRDSTKVKVEHAGQAFTAECRNSF